MRNKNGFTLVELLAVIVVLAIIMIIAIPAVLRVMTQARKSTFVLYCNKVINAVESQYVYDAELGAIGGQGYYVYDIEEDLSLTSTGSFKGYVVVDAYDVDEPHYILYLHDNNYMITGWDINAVGSHMPEVGDINPLALESSNSVQTDKTNSEVFATSKNACENAKALSGIADASKFDCYNPEGFVIQNA